MSKILSITGIFFCLLFFYGFEKIPVMEDFQSKQTLTSWMYEAAGVEIEEAYQVDDKLYLQLDVMTRESDQVQTVYVEATSSDEHQETLELEWISLETYQDRIQKADTALTDEEQSELIMSLAFDEKNKRVIVPNFLKKGVKTADQLVLKSHMLGLVTRPVSSSFRLMTWMGGTAEDIVPTDFKRFFEDKRIPPLRMQESMDIEAFEERLNKLLGDERAYGTMALFIGGEEYFPRQFDAFLEAEKNIDVRIFIFDNDDFGVQIADVLKEKSKEVGVRVLIDGMGMIMGEGNVPNDLPAGFVPPRSMPPYLKKDTSIQVRVRPNAWFKADHTKTIFVDDEICFTGGMNFGREYRYNWHDLMVELRGPIVQKLHQEFELAWSHAGKLGDLAYLRSLIQSKTFKRKVSSEGFLIRPLYTRAKEQQIYQAQLEAIQAAKKYIYISNAYFSDNAILYELIRARRRGVDVRVILPVHGNHAIMNKSNMVTANIMFENGIRVYFYPGMSHIKAAIYDGWLTTGSANFDKLSFRDNLELNIATSDPETVEEFRTRLFEKDFDESLEMTEKVKTNFQDRLAEFLAEQL